MPTITCLEQTIENPTNVVAKICIEPVEEGQGLTIGNALRRVLLSDMPGIAIVGARINNVSHEFSTIPGLHGDMLEVLLNLKQIVFKGTLTGPVVARFDFHGPGTMTGKNFRLPQGIELVDSSQHIAYLDGQNNLENNFAMEVLIEPGCGYILSEDNMDRLPKGFLGVDAVFMPVRKANFFVETSQTSANSKTESIIFELTTDGSVEPVQVINDAAVMLEKLFASLTINSALSSQSLVVLPEEVTKANELDNTLLGDLDFPVRAYNALQRAGMNTLGDLVKYSRVELLELKNFGQKSFSEVSYTIYWEFGILMAKTENDVWKIEKSKSTQVYRDHYSNSKD